MSLVFINIDATVPDVELHIGESAKAVSWREVESVQVDGDELARVRDRFPDMPHPRVKHIATYVGDFARMIAANWGFL